jgi:hypothetical protein
MVKISSDLRKFQIDARDATWFTTTLVELEKVTSPRGPDQKLQRRQRVYRYLGVQQALVLVQIEMKLKIIRKRSRLETSRLKKYSFRPLWSLTYIN